MANVIEVTGKSRSAIYADIKAGAFPKPVSIGLRAVAWTESSISKWIQKKIDMQKEYNFLGIKPRKFVETAEDI